LTGTKYGELVKPLNFREGRGGANARELVFVGGEELGGFELNFIVGIYDQTGDWAPGTGAHTHPFDECLLFFGHDTGNMGYLGADLELALGKERETHKITVPTVVVAPKGMPHCPLITEKVYQPFGHFHLALAPSYKAVRVPQEGTTDGKKYDYLVKPFDFKPGPGGGAGTQIVSLSGDDLEGLELNFSMDIHTETGEWYPGKGSLVRPYNSCLVFFGHDMNDIGYLGAEITIELGEEHEKHTFDVPTFVSLPRGTPHFPIVCSRLEKPYSMVQVGLGNQIRGDWTS
jgi:hypothetical protein